MQHFIPLRHNRYYHIYNRGINSEDLFQDKENYLHFLRLYDKYIEPVADTYAWCLLKNHFHLLVRIRGEEEILQYSKPLSGLKTTDRDNQASTLSAASCPDSGLKSRMPKPDKQFSHLFNSYVQAYNKMYSRHGGLFETPFKRVEVTSEKYFKNLIYYIHHNPIRHGFVQDMIEYPWSSYLSIISVKPSKLKRDKVIGWFSSYGDFIEFHKNSQDNNFIKQFIIE